jgi:hypothetical protein
MAPGPTTLQVLLVEEKDQGWTAQCLQFDISVHANTLEDVMYAFERALAGHQAAAASLGVEPFQSMPPAPERCWKLWSEARRLQVEASPSFRIDHGPSISAPVPELRYRRSDAHPC